MEFRRRESCGGFKLVWPAPTMTATRNHALSGVSNVYGLPPDVNDSGSLRAFTSTVAPCQNYCALVAAAVTDSD